MDVLLELAPMVNWLNTCEPVNTKSVPSEYSQGLKHLENLGLVYRRNSQSCGLQRRRLLRLIERVSESVDAETKSRCQFAFAVFLQDAPESSRLCAPKEVLLNENPRSITELDRSSN